MKVTDKKLITIIMCIVNNTLKDCRTDHPIDALKNCWEQLVKINNIVLNNRPLAHFERMVASLTPEEKEYIEKKFTNKEFNNGIH